MTPYPEFCEKIFNAKESDFLKKLKGNHEEKSLAYKIIQHYPIESLKESSLLENITQNLLETLDQKNDYFFLDSIKMLDKLASKNEPLRKKLIAQFSEIIKNFAIRENALDLLVSILNSYEISELTQNLINPLFMQYNKEPKYNKILSKKIAELLLKLEHERFEKMFTSTEPLKIKTANETSEEKINVLFDTLIKNPIAHERQKAAIALRKDIKKSILSDKSQIEQLFQVIKQDSSVFVRFSTMPLLNNIPKEDKYNKEVIETLLEIITNENNDQLLILQARETLLSLDVILDDKLDKASNQKLKEISFYIFELYQFKSDQLGFIQSEQPNSFLIAIKLFKKYYLNNQLNDKLKNKFKLILLDTLKIVSEKKLDKSSNTYETLKKIIATTIETLKEIELQQSDKWVFLNNLLKLLKTDIKEAPRALLDLSQNPKLWLEDSSHLDHDFSLSDFPNTMFARRESNQSFDDKEKTSLSSVRSSFLE